MSSHKRNNNRGLDIHQRHARMASPENLLGYMDLAPRFSPTASFPDPGLSSSSTIPDPTFDPSAESTSSDPAGESFKRICLHGVTLPICPSVRDHNIWPMICLFIWWNLYPHPRTNGIELAHLRTRVSLRLCVCGIPIVAVTRTTYALRQHFSRNFGATFLPSFAGYWTWFLIF